MAREKFQTLTEQMFYILLCLRQECCGTDIMAQVSALTGGRVSVGPGTLYNLLESFLTAGMIRQTRVEGSIRCDRDGLLYTSVPQNGNWHLYVDGQEVEPTLVGDCMISAPLTQGEHSIVLKYRNRAFEFGSILTLLCGGTFALFSYLAYRPELEKRRKK